MNSSMYNHSVDVRNIKTNISFPWKLLLICRHIDEGVKCQEGLEVNPWGKLANVNSFESQIEMSF